MTSTSSSSVQQSRTQDVTVSLIEHSRTQVDKQLDHIFRQIMRFRGTNNNQSNQLQKQPRVTPIKLLLLGNTRSGKTTTLQRYCLGAFKERYLETIGVDFRSKMVVVNGNDYRVQIWDTAGQERFRSITRMYHRGTDGVLLFYNIRHRYTFDYMTNVLKEVSESCPKLVPIILVGTGSDVSLEDREVTYEEGLALAESIRYPNGVPFFEVSPKINTNVEDMFHHMYEMVLGFRPCICFRRVKWQPKLHSQCHEIQKFIFKLILIKNIRSFNGGAHIPNDIILYIFNFLGVAKYEEQWYGKKAIEESKKSTTNYRQQVNNVKKEKTCVVM
jgi:small GTP-binding protein